MRREVRSAARRQDWKCSVCHRPMLDGDAHDQGTCCDFWVPGHDVWIKQPNGHRLPATPVEPEVLNVFASRLLVDERVTAAHLSCACRVRAKRNGTLPAVLSW